MNFYKKIVNYFVNFFEIIAVMCLVAMVVVVLVQVIGRYIFSVVPGWSEEMARQFMILFSFIGIAIGVRDKIHIAMTIIADRINKKAKLVMEIVGKILILVLGIMMSINMGKYISKLRYNRLPGSGLPVAYIYIFPTIVGILVALVAVYQIYDHFRFGTDEDQASPKEIVE